MIFAFQSGNPHPMKIDLLFRLYVKIISLVVMIFGFSAKVCAQYGAPVHERMVFKGFIKSRDKSIDVGGLKVTANSMKGYNRQFQVVSSPDGSFSFTSFYGYHYFPGDSFKIMIEDTSQTFEGQSAILKDTAILLTDRNRYYVEYHSHENLDYIYECEFVIGENDTDLKSESKTIDTLTNSNISYPTDEKKVHDFADTGLTAEDSSQTIKIVADLNAGPLSNDELPLNSNEKAFLRVFPNPGEGIFNLLFIRPGKSGYEINVFDLNGQIIFSDYIKEVTKNQLYKLDLSHYSTGSYLIRVESSIWLFSTTVVKK